MAKGKFVKALVEAAEKAGKLDMSEAARMARARELGFDNWLTDDVKRAIDDAYGKQGYTFGVRAMTSKPDGSKVIVKPGDYVDNSFLNLDDIEPRELGGASSLGFDVDLGEVSDEDHFNELVNKAISSYAEEGDQIVVIAGRHNIDDVNNDMGETLISDPVVVKVLDKVARRDNEGILRSVNAAFDPAKKDSPNLLASILPAAAGVGGTAAMLGQSESAQAMPEPKGKFAKSLMDTYLKQQVAKSMSPDERLQYGQGFGMQDKIEPVQNEWAAKAAEYSDKYNKWRRENVHPVVDMALPVGELPADVLRKMSYGDKVRYMDSVMAGLGML